MAYAVFNDGGCLDGPYHFKWEADAAELTYDPDEPDLRVSELCDDHEGQEKDSCLECWTEEDK